MPEITVTTTVTFDPEKFYEMASFFDSVSLWVRDIHKNTPSTPDHPRAGIVVSVYTDPDVGLEGGLTSELVTWQQLGEAIAHLASGTLTNHDDSEFAPDDYHVIAANDILHRFDEADWDSETEDVILQQAVFGKVIYG